MFYILIFLCLTSAAFSNPLIGDETAGITPAAENEFPFIVSIYLDVGGRGHFCTGSLITRTHVLTAAHCFDNIGNPRNVRVLVGTNDLDDPGEGDERRGKVHRLVSSRTNAWITFDAWARRTNNQHLSQYGWNDIAIVTLFSEVDENIPLARLSHHAVDQLYGRTAVTAGWGDMINNGKPNLLQKSSLSVMSRTECEDNMSDLGHPRGDVWDNELCSKADPQVILGWGDSGGPLLIDGNVIIGVNEGMCPKDVVPIPTNAFNLHLSIDYYRKFIRSVTGRCS